MGMQEMEKDLLTSKAEKSKLARDFADQIEKQQSMFAKQMSEREQAFDHKLKEVHQAYEEASSQVIDAKVKSAKREVSDQKSDIEKNVRLEYDSKFKSMAGIFESEKENLESKVETREAEIGSLKQKIREQNVKINTIQNVCDNRMRSSHDEKEFEVARMRRGYEAERDRLEEELEATKKEIEEMKANRSSSTSSDKSGKKNVILL